MEDGLHVQHIIKGYRLARNMALEKLKELSISIDSSSPEEKRSLLEKCAQTALNSKLIAHQKVPPPPPPTQSVAVQQQRGLWPLRSRAEPCPGAWMRRAYSAQGWARRQSLAGSCARR